jgi:hypothetical protein
VSSSASLPVDEIPSTQAAPLLTRRDSSNLFIIVVFLQNLILLLAGSGPLSLLLLTTVETICYYLISRHGKTDINATIILTIGLAHIIIASFIKIFLLQSLDDNLIVPDLTEFITLLYFSFLALAFAVARRLPIPRFRIQPEPNLKTLELLIVLSTVLMILPMVSTGSSAEVDTNGQTNFLGVATRGFATVAMVASIVHALKKSNGAQIFDAWSVSILGLSLTLGMAGNSREGILAPILTLIVVPLFHGYRFSRRMIAGGVAFVAFVSFVLSPALLIVRGERQFLSFVERIEKTIETTALVIIRDPATLDATQRPLDTIQFSIWGRYFGQPVPFSDRIGLIQTTDALAAASYGGNYVMTDGSFRDMIVGLFPNFVLDWFDVYVERTKTTADRVASGLGLADTNAASFLAIPLDAEAYATGGPWLVITQTFLSYLLVFYINRLAIGKRSTREVLPPTLLLLGYHVCTEGDAGALLYYTMRVLPQFIISFHLIFMAARTLGSTQPNRAT